VVAAVFVLSGSAILSVVDVNVFGSWWTWRVGFSLLAGAGLTFAVFRLLPIRAEVRWRIAVVLFALLPLWSIEIAVGYTGSRFRPRPPSAPTQQAIAAAMIGIAVTLLAVVLWWAGTGQQDSRE
jgi:hypothetical protein